MLGGALDLDEAAVPGLDDIHVGLGAHVLLIRQVEAGDAVDDPHRDGRQGVGEHRLAGASLDEAALRAPGDGIGQGHIGAGDRRGAGTAVGLQHIAVQGDRVLTQCGDVDDAAQAAADEAGDLVGAASDLAPHGLPAGALRPGPGEHGVLGGHPALATALAPTRNALGEGGGAQDPGAPEGHQDRSLGVVEPVAGHGHGAQLVDGAAVLAGEGGSCHGLRLPGAHRASGRLRTSGCPMPVVRDGSQAVAFVAISVPVRS